MALDGPRVIVVDDLHWLDPSSAGVYDELVALSARLPLVVLAAGRPDPARSATRGDHVRSITLSNIRRSDSPPMLPIHWIFPSRSIMRAFNDCHSPNMPPIVEF